MLRGTRERVTRRRLLGLAILIVVPALVALGTYRPNPLAEQETVWVVFDEAKGLAKVNRDVRVAGVNVGEIGEVVRAGDDAKLELKLEPGVVGPVYADATASLRPHAAFEGDAFVDLDPGTPEAGELGDRPIPKAQTHVYVALDESLRGLDAPRREAVAGIVSEQAKTATPAAERSVQRLLKEAPATLKAAGPAARAARGPTGSELRTSIRNLSLAAPALGSRAPRMNEVVRDAERTLAGVGADDGRALDAVMVALPGAVADLRDNADMLVGVTSRIKTLTGRAEPVLAEATPLLEDAGPLMRRSVPVLRRAPNLARELELVLTDVASATPAFRALIAPIGGAVEKLDTKALPSLTKTSRLGQPAYRQFLAAGTGLTGALAPFKTNDQDPLYGAGHYARVSGDVVNGLLGMTNTLPGVTSRTARACADVLRDATGTPVTSSGCGG